MGRCCLIVSIVAVILLAFFAHTYFYLKDTLEFDKVVAYTHSKDNCKAIRGPLGAEDTLRWKEYILTTNLDALSLWQLPSKDDPSLSDVANTQEGAIWVLHSSHANDNDNNDNNNKLDDFVNNLSFTKATMINFPKDTAFHAHGFGLFGDDLFVINHAYHAGGERVDIFTIKESSNNKINDDNNDNDNGLIELHYKRTLDFSECCMGVLNDIAPVSNNEFYITQYLPFIDDYNGRKVSGITPISTMFYLLNSLNIKLTTIRYCKFDDNDNNNNNDVKCKVVGPKAKMWNGITSSANKQQILALKLFEKKVIVFDRDEDNELIEVKSIQLADMCDNIHYDSYSNKYWLGGTSKASTCFAFIHHISKTNGKPNTCLYDAVIDQHNNELKSITNDEERKKHIDQLPLACGSHSTSIDATTYEVNVPVNHDGTLLSSASTAIPLDQHHIVLGSYCDNGILICSTDNDNPLY